MKKLLIGITSVLLFLFLQPVKAQSVLNFKFVNKTGITLYGLFVSESDDEKWGGDLLPEDVIEDGETVDIKFARTGDGGCKWDIKATKDLNGKGFYWVKRIDLCEVSILTFYLDDEGKFKWRKE